MPIQVSWGDPQKTIALSSFGETWTLEDAHNMIDEMYKLTTSVDHTVHTVMDFSNSRTSPTQLMSVGQHVMKRKVPNSGISVIVKANSFLKVMTQLIGKLFVKESPMYTADSLEEAFQIIQKYEQDQAIRLKNK